MKLYVIHDGASYGTVHALGPAATTLGAEIVDIAWRFDPLARDVHVGGDDAVLCLGTSAAAELLATSLGVDARRCHLVGNAAPTVDPVAQWRRRGLPVRRERHVSRFARDDALRAVEELGGFPLGLRTFVRRGAGQVVRVDSEPSLHSAVDYLAETGSALLLGEWIERPLLWRVVIAAGRAIGIGKRHADTLCWNASGGGVVVQGARADVTQLARAALTGEFGAVDVLERDDGTFALIDAHAPPPLDEVVTWCDDEARIALLRALFDDAA